MKKILVFSLAYYPSHVSGAEAAVKEITERVNDVEFHMVTLRFNKVDKREEQIGNVLVHRVGVGSVYFSKIIFIPLAVFKAHSLHLKYHFDALWGLMTYMLLPITLVRLTGLGVPYVLTLQDGDPYDKVFSRWFILPITPLLDYGFRKVTVIQAISTYLSKWPGMRGSKSPVEIVHNGANPKDLSDSTSVDEIDELKIKLGKQPTDIYLVNTARLEYQKAQDVVIRALPNLPENIKFLIVGGGSDEVMLKDLVKEMGIGNRVIFTGNVDRNEVTKYRKVSDIFVAPSRSEGLGNAFLSAMASRLPVIATQEGGLAEFIFDEKRNKDREATAWVVDKDDSSQIVSAVKDILANPEKVKQITTTARKLVAEEYNWDSVAKQMRERVFAKVLD
jgi:glycosyltransferase involved in cell wall biosynthesis